ncbi:hypothetical protein KAW08_04330 [bacterium]|nr:hypothetical protein [bacterium]
MKEKKTMRSQSVPYSKLAVPAPFIEGKEPWIELYYFAWECAFKHIRYYEGLPSPYYMGEGCTDVPKTVFQWDTCFMTLFTKYAPEVFPGIESLDNFYDTQRGDGYISLAHQIDTHEDTYGKKINPPLYAWVEWEYFVYTGDSSRLKRIFPILVRYFDWIKRNRRRENGIYWFEGTGSTGMDNSPRAYQESTTGGEIGWIDLTCQQSLSSMYLAMIAKNLGLGDMADRFNQEYNQISDIVNRWMWNERTSFYYDVFLGEENVVSCMTVAGYWPLISKVAPEQRAKAMVKHLKDKTKFMRLHMVPTLAYSDPNYREDGGYWVGGVWPPTNYMIVRGLVSYGFDDLAAEIAQNHIANMRMVFDEFSPATIWECYAPDLKEPAKSHGKRRDLYVRKDFVGWGGLGTIAMLIENIIGITINVPENKLYWRINLCQEHGIKNLNFKNKLVSLYCQSREDRKGTARLRISSEIGFTLCVSLNDESKEFHVIPNRENIFIVGE